MAPTKGRTLDGHSLRPAGYPPRAAVLRALCSRLLEPGVLRAALPQNVSNTLLGLARLGKGAPGLDAGWLGGWLRELAEGLGPALREWGAQVGSGRTLCPQPAWA